MSLLQPREPGWLSPMSWRGRALLVALGLLVILPVLAYGWARLSTSSSGLARAIVWMDADVKDYTRFPARRMRESEQPLTLERREVNVDLGLDLDPAMPGDDLDSFLEQTETAAFIVIRDDEIIAERYYHGYSEGATVTSFSVAKSFISALIGIAVEDGAIGSIDDSVTRYVPELEERDPRFADITIHHLLTMSSGLRFEEQGLPWSDDAKTYYATDLRTLALEDTEIVELPGTRWHYNNYNPLLLGMILERATGVSVAEYLERRLWKPLGPSSMPPGVSTARTAASKRWRAASTRARSTSPSSASSISAAATGEGASSYRDRGYEHPPRRRRRRPTTATGGGWSPTGPSWLAATSASSSSSTRATRSSSSDSARATAASTGPACSRSSRTSYPILDRARGCATRRFVAALASAPRRIRAGRDERTEHSVATHENGVSALLRPRPGGDHRRAGGADRLRAPAGRQPPLSGSEASPGGCHSAVSHLVCPGKRPERRRP